MQNFGNLWNPFWDFSYDTVPHGYIPVLHGYIPVSKIVAYLSCSAGHTHFAQTKISRRHIFLCILGDLCGEYVCILQNLKNIISMALYNAYPSHTTVSSLLSQLNEQIANPFFAKAKT